MYATEASQNASVVYHCHIVECQQLQGNSYNDVISHMVQTHQTPPQYLPSPSNALTSLRKMLSKILYRCNFTACNAIVSRKLAYAQHLEAQHNTDDGPDTSQQAVRIYLCPLPACTYFNCRDYTAIRDHLATFHYIANPADRWDLHWWLTETQHSKTNQFRLWRLVRCLVDGCGTVCRSLVMKTHLENVHGLVLDPADNPVGHLDTCSNDSVLYTDHEFSGFACPVRVGPGRCCYFVDTIDQLAEHVRSVHTQTSQRKKEACSVFLAAQNPHNAGMHVTKMSVVTVNNDDSNHQLINEKCSSLVTADSTNDFLDVEQCGESTSHLKRLNVTDLNTFKKSKRKKCNADVEYSNGSSEDEPIAIPDQQSRINVNMFICNECGGSYKSEIGLQAHVNRIHLKMRNYDCSYCGKQFHTNFELQNHKESEMNRSKPTRSAKIDEWMEQSIKIYSQHQQSDGFPKYSCPVNDCLFKFLRQDNLRQHLDYHLSDVLKCDKCQRSFTSPAEWSDHQLSSDHFICELYSRKPN
ncbi:hypothetical protein HK096_010780 [Nowakowskiella sp. JEL0078]|nr:hypothetical protein HK096_010780 [Nowakowskiella sp. JEL0078]